MKCQWLLAILMLAVAAVVVTGCSQGKKVERIDPTEQVDLSGRWNDTDSRLVSEKMISDCLSKPWRVRHAEKHGERPTVIVGQIRNKTSEHISVGTFIADIERALINSGEVEMVASPEEREQIREERADQQEFSSQESIKQWGREHGADYMMIGTVDSIEDRERGEMIIYYQVDLTLVDLETNQKVWLGQEKIKKYITMGSYSR
jgi:uncharacterized protein (TIGR02722 family)